MARSPCRSPGSVFVFVFIFAATMALIISHAGASARILLPIKPDFNNNFEQDDGRISIIIRSREMIGLMDYGETGPNYNSRSGFKNGTAPSSSSGNTYSLPSNTDSQTQTAGGGSSPGVNY